jgi:hypothetical protein
VPGPCNKATEIYARDAFLTTLNDDELRRRIMMACSPPETLAAVFDRAVRASTMDETFRSSAFRENSWSEHGTRNDKIYAHLTNQESKSDRSSNDNVGCAELQRLLKDQQRLLSQLQVAKNESLRQNRR